MFALRGVFGWTVPGTFPAPLASSSWVGRSNASAGRVMTASRVAEFPTRRAAAASPVNKLRVLEQVRRLICEGELPRCAMFVVQYLAEITDRDTAAAVVELNTIAKRIGTSRATVVRTLKKLIDAGLIERKARRKGKQCFASEYRLADVGSQVNLPQVTHDPTPVHRCTTFPRALRKPPPNLVLPDGLVPASGDPAQPRSPSEAARHKRGPPPGFQNERGIETVETDWTEWAEWLATQGRYRRFAPGGGEAYKAALDDLDRWRRDKGDQAVLRALDDAKGLKLYASPLIDYLRNTYPGGGRTSRGGP